MTREQVYDYPIVEKLTDGTEFYWMEDQWLSERRQSVPKKMCVDSRYWKPYLLATWKILLAILQIAAIATWFSLKLLWKGFWILFVLFCVQGLIGSAIVILRP